MMDYFIIAAFFIPVVSSVTCALFSRVMHKLLVQIFSLSTVIFLTGVSLYSLFVFESPYVIKLMPWMTLGTHAVDWCIAVDKLTLVMFSVVAIVSLLVRIYSFEYMHDDPSKLRFFSYLSLFAFAMLVLVASDNFVQLFVGWEGVGLCSYLLIGFWFKKSSANNAAIKAFIVNRIADVFLIIGIGAVYKIFGTLNFAEVFSQIETYKHSKIFGFDAINFICFALFVGCMGKSAQFGFHVWLPDAMEGPTPISALIHAATMVTAGIFLIVRCSPLFNLADSVNGFIILIGSLSAIFAATIALFVDDIKKIIAYSTCSQLGYMFVACGAKAYDVAIFHLVTHAFFKALLFLSAGSVIHGVSGVQNIYEMPSNLWRKMPFTYVMFWIGSLALAGIFPFAGFYSKDLIVQSVYGLDFAFVITLVVALLTAVYSWRLIIVVFHSKTTQLHEHAHEPSWLMRFPLLVLAMFSIVSGFVLEHFFHINSADFWHGSLIFTPIIEGPWYIKLLPLVCGIMGIVSAFLCSSWFFKIKDCCINWRCMVVLTALFLLFYFINIYLMPIFLVLLLILYFDKRGMLLTLMRNKYYVDELYAKFIVCPLRKFSQYCWQVIDVKGIDFVPNFLAGSTQEISKILLKLNSGYLYNYIFFTVSGTIFMLGIILLNHWLKLI